MDDAILALQNMSRMSVERGISEMDISEINAEIYAARHQEHYPDDSLVGADYVSGLS